MTIFDMLLGQRTKIARIGIGGAECERLRATCFAGGRIPIFQDGRLHCFMGRYMHCFVGGRMPAMLGCSRCNGGILASCVSARPARRIK